MHIETVKYEIVQRSYWYVKLQAGALQVTYMYSECSHGIRLLIDHVDLTENNYDVTAEW